MTIMTTLALMLAITGCVVVPAPGPPPAPQVEVYGPVPWPGAVWVVGEWHWHSGHRAWEWQRGHWR